MTIVCMYAMLIGCDYDSNSLLPAGAILQELCSYGLAMLATDSNATWCLQQLVSDLRSPQEVSRYSLSLLWWLCFFSRFQPGTVRLLPSGRWRRV